MRESIENIRSVCSECLKPNPNFLTIPLQNLVGKFVKLAFAHDIQNEYMWVEVTKVGEETELEGKLDNNPVLVTNLKCGDSVKFNRNEIISIYDG